MIVKFQSKSIKFGRKKLKRTHKDETPKNQLIIGTKDYKTVTIGNQVWMAENIAWEEYGIWAENHMYGRLYTWNEAMTIAGLIDGWHLPSEDEFRELYRFVGNTTKPLKSTYGWSYNSNGTDDYGFCALPGGWYRSGTYHDTGLNANFLISNNANGCVWNIDINTGTSMRTHTDTRYQQYESVRLIKDSV